MRQLSSSELVSTKIRLLAARCEAMIRGLKQYISASRLQAAKTLRLNSNHRCRII